MPYLYTTAEEMARTGVPIVRPLFLEFPYAAADKHPVDLDAGSEFLFGPDLLVAPPPHPDELDAYEVRLPPVTWYDYWTGEKIERHASNASQDHAETAETKTPGRALATKPLIIHHKLDVLPVYVREGSILPMQPLTLGVTGSGNWCLIRRQLSGLSGHQSERKVETISSILCRCDYTP